MKKRILGLVTAPFTPMHQDGTIAIDKIPAMVDMLINNGIKGMFVCGSTGEGPSMTTSERMNVAAAFVKAAAKRITVLVHVGHNSIQESIELARHAQLIGADYISTTPPTYFKITTISTLVDCLADIAAAAPLLPLYYYNIPALTGINLDMVELLKTSKSAIPNFAGIKYTTPLLHEYQACLNFGNKEFDVLFGTDEMLLGALAVGAEGFIGSTYNFVAPVYQQIISFYKEGDMKSAQNLQLFSVEMVRVIVKHGGLRAQKAMMKLIGMDCGPVRLPQNSLKDNEYIVLENDLNNINFFKWANLIKGVQEPVHIR
ncbi:MAG: dihydrodipicolinate synthase family protein [Mucilaginibacter sp.]|uniref:dihydrodipicolinate synthase family protein n=1 Tax=Mucilaginibacter sp. TaxID=1882438 RepID=UPI00326444D9